MSKCIGVNINDVLVPFMPAMNRFHLRTPHKKKNIVHDFYSSEDYRRMEPLLGSREILNILSSEYTILALTGRRDYARDATEQLITTHFDSSISDILYLDKCWNIGVDVMIHDDYQACLECLYLGMGAINFVGNPMYPWCTKNQLGAVDWFDVFKCLNNSRHGIIHGPAIPGDSYDGGREEEADGSELVQGTGNDPEDMGREGGWV